MDNERKRTAEVRLIVIVIVNLADSDLLDAVAASGGKSIRDIVSSEVVSNLESVPYVEAVVTSQL